MNMKKIKVKKYGLRRKTTAVLWTLLVASIAFGIYKNFTAIDQHTIHEEKVIETKVIDTNFITSYVEEFAQTFYAWNPTKEDLEKRTEELKNYLNEDLQQLNQEMIRSDIPTKSIVEKVKIWKVEQVNKQDYKVLFSVKQRLEEKREDKVENHSANSAYSLLVKTDEMNRIVILSNPIMAALPKKLEQKKREILQDDLSINAKEKEEILNFLNTFFKAYPSANKTELLYYCDIPNLEEINKDYVFSDIKSINYFETKEGIKVNVAVTYLDKETKAIMNSVYDLRLKNKDKKWVITNGI